MTQDINRDLLTVLKGVGEVQRGHQQMIASMFRLLGYYGQILDAQFTPAESPAADTGTAQQARELLQTANSEVEQLRRLYELQSRPEQPN